MKGKQAIELKIYVSIKINELQFQKFYLLGIVDIIHD